MKTILLTALAILISCNPILDYVNGTTDVVIRLYITPTPHEIKAPIPSIKISKDTLDKYFIQDPDGIYRFTLYRLQILRQKEWVFIHLYGVSPITGEGYVYKDQFLISPFEDFVLENFKQDSVKVHLIVRG